MIPVAIASCKRPAECFLNAPSPVEPCVYGEGSNAKVFSPFRDCHGFSIVGKTCHVPLVSGLRDNRSPAAVFGAVVSIVINAVNRVMLAWSRPHIFVKGEEVVPSFANSNPSAAIVFVLMVIGIVAAPFHVSPVIVLRRIAQAVSGSVLFCLVTVHAHILSYKGATWQA